MKFFHLTEQYSAMADALSVLSEQLGRPGNPEPYKSGRVAAFFASLGTPPLECAVTLDDLGRTRQLRDSCKLADMGAVMRCFALTSQHFARTG